MKNKVICVYNKPEIFEKVIKTNENLQDFEIISFDNTQINTPITKHYNNFIKEQILDSPDNNDFWCLFIHQDFGLIENITPKLEEFKPEAIYGAVGVKLFRGVFFGKKSQNSHLGFKKYLAVEYGRILQGNDDFNFTYYGREVNAPVKVDAVDCCCIILHSSLIKKYNLQFDENLSFHMYAEELCYRAQKEFDIPIVVAQLNCFHMGKGSYNEEFQKSTQYVKNKFNIERVPSTCIN